MAESTEVIVARLDERMKGMEMLFGQLVEEQKKMATSYEELVKSNQKVALLETDLIQLKSSVDKLWAKYDGIVNAGQKRTDRWMTELVKTALGMAAAMLLYHLGMHAL